MTTYIAFRDVKAILQLWRCFFRGRRQWPQARKSADPGGHEACGAVGRFEPWNILSLRVLGARGLGGFRSSKQTPGSANPVAPAQLSSLLGPRDTTPAVAGVSGRSASDAGTENGVQIGLKLGFQTAPRTQFRSQNTFAYKKN